MKVLIVEDRNENALAALEFFENKGMKVKIKDNAQDAIKALRKEIFLAAILDVEIPLSKGRKPEKLGPEVGWIAKETETPHVYLTGGYFHHGPRAKVFLDELCLKEDEGDMVPDKSTSGAWAKAWEILQSTRDLEKIYEARVRFKERADKVYERR